jgi:murein tripeptide amidase MpaA
MITEYGTDEDVTRYLDNYDFHFIPVMNPDGYKHSWDDVII